MELVLWIVIAFVAGLVAGFIIVSIRIDHKPSGILHIKQTAEKDYYTIEITEDLDEIPKKKEIVLRVDASR